MKPKTLKEFLEINKMTETELAKKLHLGQSFINLLKHGKARPSAMVARRISAFTKVPEMALLYPEDRGRS